MKITKLLMLVLISSFIGLVSCGEDASSPTSTNIPGLSVQDLFPMTVGSWWTYETYATDEAGNKTGEEGFDSVYVSGIETVGGHDAFALVTVNTDSEGSTDTETMYYRYDGNKVMMYYYIITSGMPIDFEPQWVVFADLANSDWLIINDSFTQTISEQGMEFDLEFDLDFKGSHDEESTYNYLGTDYKSMAFTVLGVIDATGEVIGQTITVNMVNTLTTIQAQGIGNVKGTQSNISTGNMGDNEEEYSEKTLINYHIAD
ncbi:MAG: hypothetical protein PF588_07505 [Candidatus Kapabacteria bacterium]|jgi:hypothetical protein|nr:hypothetical protein [Candidatus Kapabacteria bacterium]